VQQRRAHPERGEEAVGRRRQELRLERHAGIEENADQPGRERRGEDDGSSGERPGRAQMLPAVEFGPQTSAGPTWPEGIGPCESPNLFGSPLAEWGKPSSA
jgi:hypothetical protein